MESFASLDRFHQFTSKYEDPRTRDFFLMSSPVPTLALTAAYLFLVKVTLPGHMRDKKPYQLKSFVIIYNFIQVVISTWLFIGFLAAGWLRPNGLECFEANPNSNIIRIAHGYYLSKFLEFVDTILFVLRKKDNQVTNLHLYHHCIMPIGSWLGVKYVPGGTMTFLGLINSFIHIVMYSYYMLSAMGPHMQKFLWWKKYVTVLQLIQFVLGLSNSVHALAYGCLPKAISWFNICQSIVFFLMFSHFYVTVYTKKSSKSKDSTSKPDGNISNSKESSITLASVVGIPKKDTHSFRSNGTTMNTTHKSNGTTFNRKKPSNSLASIIGLPDKDVPSFIGFNETL